MSKVIVNPDELRQFANYLDELIESLRGKKSHTSLAFEHLRQNWKDKKYNQFEKSFNTTCKDLDEFLKKTKTYTEFLRMKAAKADRYLGR